ncbi:MAG: bifunctional riboflavin kinase/FAD synthetase [Dehalococcoidia bacterium]
MSLRQQLASVDPGRETVLTIGVFDGVHQGHAYLLQKLVQLARPDYVPAVLTFSNHPVTVLRPEIKVGYLTTPRQKEVLLKQLGVELVVSLEFTPELARVEARDFIEILLDTLHPKGLVIGPDFALGRGRQGDAEFLRRTGEDLGFWVESLEPMLLEGVLVKSRVVRECIAQGEVANCSQLLGRKYSLSGTVVTGDRRGRELGFPTANLAVGPEMLLPGDGIYATWTYIDGVRHPSATSIGLRPTFDLSERVVEVYVIDFQGDLYGQELEVEFVNKLRDQEKFSDLEALIEQISQDVAGSRLALAHDGGSNGP